MKGLRVVVGVILIALGTIGFTKLIWQSGFDQGADVAICVKASFEKTVGNAVVGLAKNPACKRAKSYESNPLWTLRRRDDL